MRSTRFWVVLLVLFAWVSVSGGVITAWGQAVPTIAVLPAQASLVLGSAEGVNLNLYLTNAVAINGYDLSVTYDPAIVSLSGWAQGDFLSNLNCVYEVNDPGFFQLACVQLTRPGVSGEGNLLTLTFTGISPGTSAITLSNAKVVNKENVIINARRRHGSLFNPYDPALLDQYPLTGSVGLQGQRDRGGIVLDLGEGETYWIGPYTAVSLDQPVENLNFGPVVGDTYLVTTNQPRYLNLTPELNKRLTLTGETALPPLRLLAGNARWTDNVIDVGDLSLVGFWFGKTLDDLAPGETLAGDLNFDGVVNLRDLALVAGNYGFTSASAYHEWNP